MESMITLKAETGESRKETFNGVEHLVIPVIALVEGVLQSANSPKPELALASEFGKAPAGWNGRPVTVNHPEIRGEKVSANSPEILETEQIGQLFNTVLDGKKLKTEAWINVARANELGGDIAATVSRLSEGTIVEVSTGLFSDIDNESGTHEGERFNGVWRNVVPDHLAILDAGAVGACSIADGCGANRFNSGKCENCTCSEENTHKPLASSSQNLDDGVNGDKSLFDKFKHLIGFKNNKELSHNSISHAIEATLAQEDGFSFLVDVFKSHAIVQKEGGLFRRDFKITSSGKVKLSEESTPVRFEADFVDLVTNEEDIMDKETFVADLIANEGSKFEEGDSEWLLTLEDEQLEKLAVSSETVKIDTNSEEFITAVKAEAEKVKVNAGGGDEVKPTGDEIPQTLEEYISSAPGDMKEVLASGVRAFNSRKTELTSQIKANSKNKFSDEALATMDLATLENLAAIATPDDYSARGGPRMNEAEDPNAIPLPPQVYDLSASRKAS